MTRWRMALLLGLALAASSSLAACGARVTFADSRLELAIREAIDKPAGAILQSDLEELVFLDAGGRGITDLTGLERCANLSRLVLSDNGIRDISPLVSLSKLKTVMLNGNPLSTESLTTHVPELEERGVLVSLWTDSQDPLLRASRWATEGWWEEALKEYSSAIALDPDRPLLYSLRSFVYQMLGQPDNALGDLTTAIALDPDSPEGYFIRAGFYVAMEQWDMALADCETAIQIGPESEAYWAYYPRGLAYKGLGRTDEAIADFEKLISLALAGWPPHPSIELARQEIEELRE